MPPGNQHTMGTRPQMGGSATAKHVPKKYCSILQYIQHNNRELYDAIGDLLCLAGLFSMKSSGPGKPPKELTFLMPVKDSEMHKEIISAAYGGREHEAIAMIKSCLLYKCISSLSDFHNGDVLRTAARANATVDTSGGFTKIGGAKIIADENFVMLYTDARFHVYLLESGMLTTTPGDEPTSRASNNANVSGGAWKELREEKEVNGFMRTPAGLAKSALQTHIMQLNASASLASSMPGWITGDPNGVFYKWGVSLGKYLDAHDPRGAGLARKMWSTNPMCMIPFCAMILDKAVFDAWLLHDDSAEMKYTYEEYLTYVPKSASTSAEIAGAVITSVVESIAPGKKKTMNETAALVQQGYEKAYKDAGIPWKTKLLYDEAVFVMNDYIAAAIDKDLAKCSRLSTIIVDHYSSLGKPWLSDIKDGNHEIPQCGPMHCKLVQFALSEAFMYPNGYCEQTRRPAPLKETCESAAQYIKLPPECIDFTSHIKGFFSKH